MPFFGRLINLSALVSFRNWSAESNAVATSIEANLANAMEGMGEGKILYCRRQIKDEQLTIRFVKDDSEFRGANEISSTKIRSVMQTLHSETHLEYPRQHLELMALSAELLWLYRDFWVDKAYKAKRGTCECISFPPVSEEDSDSQYDSEAQSEATTCERSKRPCLLATRQGASSCLGGLLPWTDDMALERKKGEQVQKQLSRRNSW